MKNYYTIICMFAFGVCMIQGGPVFSTFKKKLDNGLTVIVLPRYDIPKVAINLFYNVGSKNEGSGIWSAKQKKWISERGIAHLIEHMIFKGTKKMSESDINMLTHKLSGSCNAFTSHDYTGYQFELPSQHWYEALPVMADCMKNCTFKQQLLNSELKAVVQEIKMYNDDYVSTLIGKMMSAIFFDHPYHYPVIGFKHDLWNLKRIDLDRFYKKHYGPNNAVITIVGDVDPEDVFKKVEENFGYIEPLKNYKKQSFHHSFDVGSHSVTLYRDITQPFMLMAWEVPGMSEKKDYILDLVSWIVGAGKGSALYAKLVTELGLATELQSFVYEFFDHGIFFIYAQPAEGVMFEDLQKAVLKELEWYSNNYISDNELCRAQRKTEMDRLNTFENSEKLAYQLGKSFLATGNENYFMSYGSQEGDDIKIDIQNIFKKYFFSSTMHTGFMLPIAEKDKSLWLKAQTISDQEDAIILNKIVRDHGVEKPVYANTITPHKPGYFDFPKPEKIVLSNGLIVLYHHRPGLGKIDLILDMKANHTYDAPDKQGLSLFMADALQEGTVRYSSQELAQELELYGMELNIFPGHIGMTFLSKDSLRACDLLFEVLTQPRFDQDDIERTRKHLLTELKLFWDNPIQFSGQLTRQLVYKDHQNSFNVLGIESSLNAITKEDLMRAHKNYISPHGARLALVGDLSGIEIKDLLESTLGQWSGQHIADQNFPELCPVEHGVVDYPINRDQVVLTYGGLSVDRFHEDYDKLLLFDQVFTGGVLDGMGSRLFALREETGLFYAIGGSLLAGVGRQPGMIYVRAIVSPDNLIEAERIIEHAITEQACNLNQHELEDAQRALINSRVDHFASNRAIASTYIVLDKYELPNNFFDIRPEQICSVTIDEIKKAVSNYLDLNKMVKIRVGRV